MILHISPNRHAWNVRRVVEMQDEIAKQEQKINNVEGFFKKMKEKRVLRRMVRRLQKHGSEVLEYEYKIGNSAN